MEPVKATRKKARDGELADRLSALPDCLLHDIMSSLKARQVVQTCVLGRRWRHLWRSVPYLNIDIGEFRTKITAASDFNHNPGSGGVDSSISDCDISYCDICGRDHESSSSDDNAGSSDDSSESDQDISGSDPEDSDSDSSDSCSDFSISDHDDASEDCYGGDKDKEWEDFQHFTVNLMRRCNFSQLDSFRLHIRRLWEFGQRQQVAEWLRLGMKYCTPEDPASQHKGLSPSPWRLKRLHLCAVGLDNSFMKHVTSVCRTLEDLELHYCLCNIQSFTSHLLKSLVLKMCRWLRLSEITSRTLKTLVIDGGQNTNGCLLVISTPALAYLHLTAGAFNYDAGISINDMPSLVKALINLPDHRFVTLESCKLCGDQYNLLCSVSNAASLELSGLARKEGTHITRIHEPEELIALSHNFHILRCFLKSSPNLEKLTLRRCKFPNYLEKKEEETKLNNTSSSEFLGLDFMCENLKVEIIYNTGMPNNSSSF